MTRRCLPHAHEHTLKVLLTVSRFGELDVKRLKPLREEFGPSQNLLLGSVEVAERP